jgi:hypothetical protein
LKRSAERRGVPFTLSPHEYITWRVSTEDVCHYCGMDAETFREAKLLVLESPALMRFREVFANPAHAKMQHLSIDRKDPEKGYTLENICKACWICNYIKGGVLTEAQMKQLGPQLYSQFNLVAARG